MMLQIREIETDKLNPWEENPRINDQAVDAVAESMVLMLLFSVTRT